MKKLYWILIVLGILFLCWFFLRFVIGGGEDDWIKDSRGVWIKHGAPSETPNYVLEQQEAINCALNKFENFTDEKNSQCLGTCGNYAVDIVSVPRNSEDNKIENQCEDYRNGNVPYFIELDKDGNVVRVG